MDLCNASSDCTGITYNSDTKMCYLRKGNGTIESSVYDADYAYQKESFAFLKEMFKGKTWIIIICIIILMIILVKIVMKK
jgi:hypothetical protein